MVKGRIRQSLSGYYDIEVGGVEYRTRARGNFRKKGQTPLVGDWVEFKAKKPEEGYILKIYPRNNLMIRPPVANIDAAIVVTACKEPSFSSNLLDRQLVMLEKNNIKPILYFSKRDLLTAAEYKEMSTIISYYQKFYQCFYSQSDTPREILAELKDDVVVVMGQTGAGKSTFLNVLAPHLKLETGEVSKALSRGRHTTRKTALLPIEGNLIADTPGFSSFELLDVTKEQLPLLFVDFAEKQQNCRFRGCLHLNEPQCVIKDMVQKGEILKSRYDNYLQFQNELKRQKPKYKK
ncbi:ribosome small subunit-dependent GTPase A [Liquorilactobacillus uvarum]|uniref:Small ribosomal subunit biogenesis GTPase RsgA n=1 Tax=Liquorilactobacillus uvarum DSM 19971 TaxID=1423812 RepID=A0A0R1Q6Z2_9LACO|nr:ribosome small subunit-dependent GTPase A [Liquorilactobacillus uvarum]KRL38660.1 GTPase [Liquorilactobacillus uvarum DSM 19971]